MAFSDELVFGGTAFLLGAFGSQQVTKAGRAANELTFGGELEALSDGFLGLLHNEKGRKQRRLDALARAKCSKNGASRPFFARFGKPQAAFGVAQLRE